MRGSWPANCTKNPRTVGPNGNYIPYGGYCLNCGATADWGVESFERRVWPHLPRRYRANLAANTGFPVGVTCDYADAVYVPGVEAAGFARVMTLMRAAPVGCELALSTAMDMLAPRASQQLLRVSQFPREVAAFAPIWASLVRKTGGLSPLVELDWLHALKVSVPEAAAIWNTMFANATALRLATAPNMTALAARPLFFGGHL